MNILTLNTYKQSCFGDFTQAPEVENFLLGCRILAVSQILNTFPVSSLRLFLKNPRLPGSEQFLFDHIPRTGGTYFASILAQLLGSTSENIDCGPNYAKEHLDEIERLDRYRVIVGHLRLDTVKAFQRRRPRHLISLVRDPVEQIVSTYTFWRYNVTQDLWHCNLAKDLSFSDFIRRRDLRMAVDNPLTRHFFGLWSIDGFDVSDTTKALASRMADSYAFIGVTERMEDNVNAFRRQFRTRPVQIDLASHDRNASKGAIQISDEDRRYLWDRNQLDYTLYAHVNRRLDEALGLGYYSYTLATEMPGFATLR